MPLCRGASLWFRQAICKLNWLIAPMVEAGCGLKFDQPFRPDRCAKNTARHIVSRCGRCIDSYHSLRRSSRRRRTSPQAAPLSARVDSIAILRTVQFAGTGQDRRQVRSTLRRQGGSLRICQRSRGPVTRLQSLNRLTPCLTLGKPPEDKDPASVCLSSPPMFDSSGL
jgi:hypothetical protein